MSRIETTSDALASVLDLHEDSVSHLRRNSMNRKREARPVPTVIRKNHIPYSNYPADSTTRESIHRGRSPSTTNPTMNRTVVGRVAPADHVGVVVAFEIRSVELHQPPRPTVKPSGTKRSRAVRKHITARLLSSKRSYSSSDDATRRKTTTHHRMSERSGACWCNANRIQPY